MNIFLVRHAQSESNIEPLILKTKTNIGIELSNIGISQAKQTGSFFSSYFKNNKENIKIWNSPYNRTRETAFFIKEDLSLNNIKFFEEESIYLSERQFGLVDDVDNYSSCFKHESNHYQLHKKSNHDFFARPPLGESPFDMCLRLDFFLKTILVNEPNIKNHIIISHGAAIRGLILMQQKKKYEEYTYKNPYNSSVTLIQNDNYLGQIFCPDNITE